MTTPQPPPASTGTTLIPRDEHDAICERLRAGLAEARKWRLAAALTGLYPSDTDISTPELWQTAQSEAACQLLSQRDAAQARARELEEMQDNWQRINLPDNVPVSYSQLLAQVAQLRAALRVIESLSPAPIEDPFPADWSEQIAACSECQGWAKNHPIQQGICDLHRKPLYERTRREKQQDGLWPYRMKDIARAALATTGSQLLDAVRGARDALALVYCDGCGSEAFPFRTGDHADASWGVRFTAVKTALANLNSAIGEVSHE